MIPPATTAMKDQLRAKDGEIVHEPVRPIKPMTVTLCTVSAICLPLTTILSHVETCEALLARCAARSLATFCAGVSPGGSELAGGCKGGVLEEASIREELGLGETDRAEVLVYA